MTKFIINGGNTLSGKATIDGAKNSALKLITASILADTKPTISNVPIIEDVKTMAEVLEALGADVAIDSKDKLLEIDPSNINSLETPYELVRKMRASILVAGPLLARFGLVKVAVPGGCNIGSRQIDIHLKGFEKMGARYSIEHGYVNCRVNGRTGRGKLSGTVIDLDFLSRGATENIIMAAVMAKGKTIINNATLEPEIGDLINFLNRMGADIMIDAPHAVIKCVEKLSGAPSGHSTKALPPGGGYKEVFLINTLFSKIIYLL